MTRKIKSIFLASQIALALSAHQAGSEKPLWLTNPMQMVSMMSTQFLANYEDKLRQYRRTAGFSNSLLEKYMLLPRGIKVPQGTGEVMLVATTPLQKRSGSLERIGVSKYGNRFASEWIDETTFQQSLREAGIRLSDLPRNLPLPSMRHLDDPTGAKAAAMAQMEKEAAEFAREHALPLWRRREWQFGAFILALVLIATGSWWIGRRALF